VFSSRREDPRDHLGLLEARDDAQPSLGRQPSPKELKMARVQGERTAQIAAKLSGA